MVRFLNSQRPCDKIASDKEQKVDLKRRRAVSRNISAKNVEVVVIFFTNILFAQKKSSGLIYDNLQTSETIAKNHQLLQSSATHGLIPKRNALA